MGGGGEGAYWRGGAYFKFWPIGGALIRRGRLFEGGAYLKGALIRRGRLFEGGTYSKGGLFEEGAYSKGALIRGGELIRRFTVLLCRAVQCTCSLQGLRNSCYFHLAICGEYAGWCKLHVK